MERKLATRGSKRSQPESSQKHRALVEATVEQHRLLLNHEKPLAELYWKLGEYLNRIRPSFPHGTWMKFLQENAIEPTRAAKAVKIYLCFKSASEVFGLTVEQAYAAREKKRRRRPRHQPNPRVEFACALNTICRTGHQLLESPGEWPADWSTKLFPVLLEADELLQEFARRIES